MKRRFTGRDKRKTVKTETQLLEDEKRELWKKIDEVRMREKRSSEE